MNGIWTNAPTTASVTLETIAENVRRFEQIMRDSSAWGAP